MDFLWDCPIASPSSAKAMGINHGFAEAARSQATKTHGLSFFLVLIGSAIAIALAYSF